MSVHFESATDQKDIPAKGTPAFLPPVYTDADNKEVLEDKVKEMTLAKGKQADCHAFGISLQQILEAQTSDRKPRPPSLRPPSRDSVGRGRASVHTLICWRARPRCSGQGGG